MKQSQKLSALISKIIKEELQGDYMIVSKKDPKRVQKKQAANKAGMAVVEDDPTDASSTKLENAGTLGGFYADGSHKIEQDGKVTFMAKNPLEIEALNIVYSALDLECAPDSFKKPNDNALILDKKNTCVRSVVSYLENKPYKSTKLEGLVMQIAEIVQAEDDEEELQETNMEQMPKASEIAGQVAEIMEKLKSMGEGEDPKKAKHAAKVMKYMESAKAALEALTAHETMLEEKEQAAKEDDATKQLKGVRKQIDKILKDKEMADRVMEKMSVQKMIELKSKAKKDIDEAGLARIMVNKSLKEGWVKKKVESEQLDEGVKDFIMGLAVTAASTFGGSKAKAQVPTGDKSYSATAQQYLKKDTANKNTGEYKKATSSAPSSIVLDFGTDFKSGKFEFDQANTKDLLSKFKAISDFIKAHPNSKFEIEIESSESKVPQSNIGFGQGELAKERAKSLQTALKVYTDNLEKQGIKTKGFDIKVGNTVTQGPEFKAGDKKDDEKFTKNQYVRANIVAKEQAPAEKTVFDAFSSRDMSLFLGNKLIAMLFSRTRETKDVKVQGNYTVDDGDLLVRFVDNMGKFTGEAYLIDSKTLQNKIPSEKATEEQIQWIKANGKKVG